MIQALAGTLLHSLWEGAAVALALALVLSIVRNCRIRYAGGCVAMLVFLGGLVVTFTHLVPAPPVQTRVAESAKRPIDPANGFSAVRSTVSTREIDAADYRTWFVSLWLLGVCAFYVRGMASWLAARRLRHTGVCCAPDLWRTKMNQLSARLRLSRPVALLESSLAEVPVVVGYLRPVILMPVGLLAGLPVSQVEAILLHELAHIRRYDYLVNLLQVLAEGLLFYHPAVWWISGVMRTEREYCCDDVVVATTGGARDYARALESLERRRESEGIAMAATAGNLLTRIKRLCGAGDLVTCQSALMPVVTAAILAIAAVTAVAALQTQPEVRVAVQSPTDVAEPSATSEAAQVVPQSRPKPAATDPVVSPSTAIQITITGAVKLPGQIPLPGSITLLEALAKAGWVTPGAGPDLLLTTSGSAVPQRINIDQLKTDPAANVTLTGGEVINVPSTAQIAVVGDVKIPRRFTITAPITLLEALAKAGWTTPDAGPDLLLTTPGSDTPRKISIQELQTTTDPTVNVTLTGGEVINVPDAPKVWVTGNVAHALAIPIGKLGDATVLRVIASVEGLTAYYAKTAYIYRKDQQGVRHEIAVPLKDIMHRKKQDVPLMAGDVLYVPTENGLQPQFYDPPPPASPWEGAPRVK